MSLIGQVFNKALKRNISVYIAEYGSNYKRITAAISPALKDVALARVRDHFENRGLFKEDMERTKQITITNMPHRSDKDERFHYSLQAEDDSGNVLKTEHVPEDES